MVEIPYRLRGLFANRVRQERQLEHLQPRKASGRGAGDRPHDVDDAILGLIVELRLLAAELHGRVDLDLQLAARLLLQLLGPRLKPELLLVGLGGNEVVQLEGDLLRERRRG